MATVVPDGYTQKITYPGQRKVSTLSGDISLEQNLGRLIVRRNGIVLTQLDSEGYTYSQPSGVRRIREGASPSDGRIGHWISKPDVDVVELLQ